MTTETEKINYQLYYDAVKAEEEFAAALTFQFGKKAGERRYNTDKSDWNTASMSAYNNKLSADVAWAKEIRRSRQTENNSYLPSIQYRIPVLY